MRDERTGVPGWLALASFALITLLAWLALVPPRVHFAVEGGVILVPPPPEAAVRLWLSTADRRLRLARQPDIEPSAGEPSSADVVVDIDRKYQSIVGFGAALTDSSAWLLQNRLNAPQRAALLRELFGPPPGLNFNMTRLTIGASDFSLQPYTLDDLPAGDTDPQLLHFNVAANLQDVIPSVRETLSVNPQLRIIASPWSAPAWMKTSANLIGGGLLEQFESTYADYLVKYVDTYRSYGIPIFALTLQNEPAFVPLTYPGMELPPATRARIIAQYLGPALAQRSPKTLILGWDHNWDQPDQPLGVLGDLDAERYVDGIAWHCYSGSPYAQGQVHRAFPAKDTYITECSGGDWESARNGELLWFTRDLLLVGLRQWARGIVYWNLALDEQHGPHLGGCDLCKGVVTIDSRTGEVSRNDEYYAFAHFSRFVLPGAVRVRSSDTDKGLANVAFQNAAGGSVVLVMVNSEAQPRRVTVVQEQTRFHYTLPAQSVATFEWKPRRPERSANAAPASPASTAPAGTPPGGGAG
ncbi:MULTISPECIES: glycoside hydrolase family 30 protein [Rhodanobacter]|nr:MULTISPECIES: glycoside hydrolase family 30 beta sandwich domain-containing protein [Rhodanobacter]EIM01709.1 glycoside hydrolase family protein [Rhodanobacter denitrificans]KZC21235.1 glycosyl hydrolase [Rhodanobacter denitrificans]UJJ51521.1 glycosyl hydrolase [Rhodanobacter denitrificans]UJJ59698.1 glycosyl hydrolase [Rhodanobacter denitrificans]UJM86786.1 glycosyl hydrolase [Rhodanobacter denitrificans]